MLCFWFGRLLYRLFLYVFYCESVWLMIGDKTSGLGTLCHWRLLAWSSPTETSASPGAENTFSPSQLPCSLHHSQSIFCTHYIGFIKCLTSLPQNITLWWINLFQNSSCDLLNLIFLYRRSFYYKLCTINVPTNSTDMRRVTLLLFSTLLL